MGPGMSEPNNRLVRRYQPTGQVEITWTAEDRSKKRVRRQAQTSTVAAAIIDVSVNGMYVELPLEPRAQLGDVIALSSDDNFAVAKVMRTARDEEQAKQLVGVEITEMSPEFASDLNAVVAALRGDGGHLSEWWERR